MQARGWRGDKGYHVKLPHEGLEVRVLEVLGQDILRELLNLK